MSPNTPFVKYMSFIKRAEGITVEEYYSRLEAVAEKFVAIPGCIEYRAGNVVERLMCNAQGDRVKKADDQNHAHPSWISATYEEVPVDSVLEIYFKFSEETAIEDVFATDAGMHACDCLKEIVSEASTYICDVHHIVNKY